MDQAFQSQAISTENSGHEHYLNTITRLPDAHNENWIAFYRQNEIDDNAMFFIVDQKSFSQVWIHGRRIRRQPQRAC